MNNMKAVQEFQGKRRNSCLFKDNECFIYKTAKKYENGNQLLRCYQRSCRVSAKLIKDDQNCFIYQRLEHNHLPDIDYVRYCEFLNAVKAKIITDEAPLSQIYNEEAERFEGCNIPSFRTLESTLSSIRRSHRPPLPTNFEECLVIANSPRFGRHQNNFTVCSSGGNSIIMLAGGERRQRLATSQCVYIDSTFRVTPALFYQLTTIHVVVMNKVFPAAYVLMERKTEEAYLGVFLKPIEVLPEFCPMMSMTDFEKGLVNALRRAFPGISPSGCWFHYARAIWKKVQNIGLKRYYVQNQYVKRVVGMFMALPLLPSHRIQEGLEFIQTLISESSPTYRRLLKKLKRYIQRYWLDTLGPAVLSVYKKNRRTNNNVEAFYSSLRGRIPMAHPNFFIFMEKLAKIDRDEERKLNQLDGGENITYPQSRSRKRNENRIEAATTLFDNGQLSVGEFLRRARHCCPEFDVEELENEIEQRGIEDVLNDGESDRTHQTGEQNVQETQNESLHMVNNNHLQPQPSQSEEERRDTTNTNHQEPQPTRNAEERRRNINTNHQQPQPTQNTEERRRNITNTNHQQQQSTQNAEERRSEINTNHQQPQPTQNTEERTRDVINTDHQQPQPTQIAEEIRRIRNKRRAIELSLKKRAEKRLRQERNQNILNITEEGAEERRRRDRTYTNNQQPESSLSPEERRINTTNSNHQQPQTLQSTEDRRRDVTNANHQEPQPTQNSEERRRNITNTNHQQARSTQSPEGRLRDTANSNNQQSQSSESTEGRINDTTNSNQPQPTHTAEERRRNTININDQEAQSSRAQNQNSSNITEEGEEDSSSRCKICLIMRKDCVAIPCNHYAFCEGCILHLITDGLRCGICRDPIITYMKIYDI